MEQNKLNEFFLLPLRDFVIFPKMVVPLFVGREKSINTLDALQEQKTVLLVAQKNTLTENPKAKDLYKIGLECKIIQQVQLPDNTIKILVEGLKRVQIKEFVLDEQIFKASGSYVNEVVLSENEEQIIIRALSARFEAYVSLNNKLPKEVTASVKEHKELVSLIDIIASYMVLEVTEKQELLSALCLKERSNKLITFLEREIEFLRIDKEIRNNVKDQMEKTQKEYYLNEQMRAIQKELSGEGAANDILHLETKLKKIKMPKDAKEKVKSEIQKYKMMPPMSAEATVCRNYIDCLLSLPWDKRSNISDNLQKAKQTLDEQHYGLEETKDRILEVLAVHARVKNFSGQVLCLVGPPGVGKTSLGKSIALATGREYTRIALGGVRDESEIRGHRRTYIGAMPGKIIQKISKTKVKNPLVLLDEIDKMGSDHRGDPASALLEVLDKEQNKAFNDHYLEVDFDLSEVMFITTANSLNIPPALLDRMDIVRIPGYTIQEKMHIAKDYLLPKQLIANGLKEGELKISDDALLELIRYYSKEAGVRNLERNLAKVCRKVVRKILEDNLNKDAGEQNIHIDKDIVAEYLGVRKYRFGQAEADNEIGQVVGLAWTEVGGDILYIEAVSMPGKGNVKRTGKLGEVMQESVDAAMSVARKIAALNNDNNAYFEKNDFHIHVPEGATPKDGPSAGIAICTALMSILWHRKVNKEVAMTGEITLRGKVLAIGGLREKLLAAKLSGIKQVIIPKDNEHDLVEIPQYVYEGLKIHTVTHINEVLELALIKS